MALDFQMPVQGYNPLRYNPQMPLAQTSPGLNMSSIYPGQINPNQQAPIGSNSSYTMKPSWQFGLNWQQIAASNMVQSIGAFMRNNNQKADARSYQRVQQNPLLQLPENPNTTQQSLYGMKQFASGGPTPAKAKEILHDGTAQGHPITDKQRRFFGAIAGGAKPTMAEGGRFDDNDDFDEEDFQDLKDELDRYFADKGSAPAPNEAKEDEEDKEQTEEEKPEATEEDQPIKDDAMNLLMSNQEEPEETTPTEQASSSGVSLGQSAAQSPDHSVYAQKPTDDVAAFKSGIARVENAGYNEGNKNSSAFGKYQFTAPTRENVREQFFPNISKKDFETSYKEDPKFQERVMDVYGSHLLQTYGDPHKAALAFYLGPGGVKYQNQPDYNPGHGNVSVGKYLNTFDQGYGKRQGGHISIQPETIQTNFEEGGEYELTNMQIANLKKQGYKIEILK